MTWHYIFSVSATRVPYQRNIAHAHNEHSPASDIQRGRGAAKLAEAQHAQHPHRPLEKLTQGWLSIKPAPQLSKRPLAYSGSSPQTLLEDIVTSLPFKLNPKHLRFGRKAIARLLPPAWPRRHWIPTAGHARSVPLSNPPLFSFPGERLLRANSWLKCVPVIRL